VVSFTLETRRGTWTAPSPIKPKGVSKKNRAFDEPVFRHFIEIQGRLAALLPAKQGEDERAGALH